MKLPKEKQFLILLLLTFGLLGLSSAFAQDDDDDDDDDDDYDAVFIPSVINQLARDEVSIRLEPLGFGLMGDSIDPYTGTLVLNQTDVSLPGNSGLEVAIRRIASTAQMTNMQEMFFADWVLDVPNISSLVATDNESSWAHGTWNPAGQWEPHPTRNNWYTRYKGWKSSGGRCTSGHNMGNVEIIIDYAGADESVSEDGWWDGYQLNIPGKGRQQLIRVGDSAYFSEFETSNDDVRYVTKDHWVITCLDSVTTRNYDHWQGANDGEGFVAISPDGTRYQMNQLIYMAADEIEGGERQIAKIYATEVTDVHGNWVKYDFSSDGKLTRIHSNDGREITLTYYSNSYKIHQVIANGRTWTYTYNDTNQANSVLEKVTQPDGKYWEYSLSFLRNRAGTGFCTNENLTTNYVKHPYGVTATYDFSTVRHIRSPGQYSEGTRSTPSACANGELDYLTFDEYNKTVSVTSKTLSGPSIPTSIWSYSYSEIPAKHNGSPLDWSIDKTTEVIDPAGNKKVSYFYPRTFKEEGDGWGNDTQKILAGKLKKTESFDQNGILLEEQEFEYVIGSALGDAWGTELKHADHPSYEDKVVTKRDGDTYTREYTYNTNQSSTVYSFGQPLTVKTYSNVSTTPRETVTTYTYKKNNWVLSLPNTVTTNGRNMSSYSYDSLGRLTLEKEYGQTVGTYTYHTNSAYKGALYTWKDANNRTTSYLNYYRGIPKNIKRPDNVQDQVGVDANGWITSQRDYNGYTTSYQRDSMGRITKVIPSKTQKSWLDTNITYSFGNEVIQTITRGNRRETVTYDNFFRSIEEQIRDLSSSQSIYTSTDYDAAGRMIFESFPSSTSNTNDGVDFTYDGLGRMETRRENVSPFATVTHNYLSSHRHEVIDASSQKTTRYRDGYSGPREGSLLRISQPLGVNTYLHRNIWGQLTSVQQTGTQNGYSMNQSQHYYYDTRQRLCRHRTPEGGDTLYAYDASGYMTSYAKGMGYGTSCSTPSGSSKVTLTHDAIGRVTLTNFTSSGTPDISTTYDNNGNALTTNRSGVNWTYTYDELNHLTSEKLDIDGRNYDQTYTYNTNEFLTRHVLPSGRAIDYTYDGLGREKTVKNGSTSYASGLSYHANGALSNMSYGNGQIFTQTLNNRLLPLRMLAQKGSTKALDLTYSYDARGDITGMVDGTDSSNNRTYGYDALARLTTANGPWGAGSFKYDAVANLRQKKLGSRTVNNYYNSTNRLTSTTDTSGGTRTLNYDSRGNVTKLGGLNFVYDYADQPVSISGSATGTYKYDGNLKRVKAVVNGKTIYNVYSASGKLVHVDATTDNKETDYVRGAGMTIARITNNSPTYLHPDHLGSAVAGTSSTGAVSWKEKYTPFGEKLIANAANDDLDGFTGHIDDSATGLTYMQARYYDPGIGRFLSIDPKGFRQSRPDMFNRYAYVANNPINRYDPDGEIWHIVGAGAIGTIAGTLVNAGVQYAANGSVNWVDAGTAGLAAGAASAAIAANPALAANPAAIAAIAGVTGVSGSIAGDVANGRTVSGTKAVVTGLTSAFAGPIGAKAGDIIETAAGRAASSVAGEAVGAGVAEAGTAGIGVATDAVNSTVEAAKNTLDEIAEEANDLYDEIYDEGTDL